jgi:hypothetical protein
LIPVLVKIIGVVLAVAMAFAIFGTIFSFITLLFNSNSPYIDFPLSQIVVGGEFYFLLIMAFVIAIVTLIYLMVLAVSMARYKSMFRFGWTFGLLTLWIFVIGLGSTVVLRNFPEYKSRFESLPQNQLVTQTPTITNFTKLQASHDIKINYMTGESPYMTLTGRQSDLDRTEVRVVDDTLILSLNGADKICFFCFDVGEITVDLIGPAINEVQLNHDSEFHSADLEVSELNVTAMHSSEVRLQNIQSTKLNIELAHAAEVEISGSVDSLNLELAHSAEFMGVQLQAKEAIVVATHSSYAELNVSDRLDVDASHSSDILYRGQPVLDVETFHSAEVESF